MWWHDRALLSREVGARPRALRAVAALRCRRVPPRRRLLSAALWRAFADWAARCCAISSAPWISCRSKRRRAPTRRGWQSKSATRCCSISPAAVPAPPTHRLKISMYSTRASIIVDINTSRPDIENYGINATYSLTEIATGKVVVTGQTFSRVSYDIPGQQQRFARLRGLRDAEDPRGEGNCRQYPRARLASYFVAGNERRIPSADGRAARLPRSTISSRDPIRRDRSCWSSARMLAWCANAPRHSSADRSTIPTILFRSPPRWRRSLRRAHTPGRGSQHHPAVRGTPGRLGQSRHPQSCTCGRALLAATSPDCRVVIEAGDLKRSAPLRALCERARNAVALPCYADAERDLVRLIDDEMRDAGLRFRRRPAPRLFRCSAATAWRPVMSCASSRCSRAASRGWNSTT